MGEGSSIDRRIIRARNATRNVLVTLIKDEGFDALSVKDITTRAIINRGTFYLHFIDEFELLIKTMDRIINIF